MTDKLLDAEYWAKKLKDGVNQIIVKDKNLGRVFPMQGLESLNESLMKFARHFLSELPQLTTGTIGAKEIVRGWWNEMGGKSGSVQPENITAMTIKRREIEELIDKKSFKFGDILINHWASEDNPTHKGIFVCRTAKGYQMTDGNGKFWLTRIESNKLEKIGFALSPASYEPYNHKEKP